MPEKTHHPQKDVFKLINGQKQPVEPYDLSGKQKKEPHIESLRFDGNSLITVAVDAKGRVHRLTIPADAGRPLEDGTFDYSEERQRIPGLGPIPEGSYTVNPQEVQRPTLAQRILEIPGKNHYIPYGKYPGGFISWGRCRLSIQKTPEQADKTTRDGFTIHGGTARGSAGCIDLVDNELKFCEFIEKYRGGGQTSVPLTVDYTKKKTSKTAKK